MPDELAHKRHASQIQAMIGNRQTVAALGLQQVFDRNLEILENDAAIVRPLDGIQAVLLELEVFVLLLGKIDHQHCRPVLDQAHQADRAAGHHVGDEQLFAVDHVVIADQFGAGAKLRQVGAGPRLGQREGRQAFAAGQLGQKPLLLLAAAERADRIDRADATMDRCQARDRFLEHAHFGQEGGETRVKGRARTAVLAIDQQAPVAGRAELVEHLGIDLLVAVVHRARRAMTADDIH